MHEKLPCLHRERNASAHRCAIAGPCMAFGFLSSSDHAHCSNERAFMKYHISVSPTISRTLSEQISKKHVVPHGIRGGRGTAKEDFDEEQIFDRDCSRYTIDGHGIVGSPGGPRQ
jgi:hypothetical protein